MDLKSELRMSLYGRTDFKKIELPTLSTLQKGLLKFAIRSPNDFSKILSSMPLTVYKVNLNAEFPRNKSTEEKRKAYLKKIQPFYVLDTRGQLVESGGSGIVISDFVYGRLTRNALSKAGYDQIILNLKNILGIDYSAYAPMLSSGAYFFTKELASIILEDIKTFIKKDYLDYVSVTDWTTEESIRSMAVQRASKGVLYVLSEKSDLTDYEVLYRYSLGEESNFLESIDLTGLNFSSFSVQAKEVNTQVGTFIVPYLFNEPVLFRTNPQIVSNEIVTFIKQSATGLLPLADDIRNYSDNISYYVSSTFFNFLISLRDHYNKYQSTAYLFLTEDKKALADILSGNILSLLATQRPFLTSNGLGTPLVKTGNATNDENVRRQELVRFLRLFTMGYLKEGQIITSDLAPYFSIGDQSSSIVNRIMAISPVNGSAPVYPNWITNILGTTTINNNTVPSGAMVMKVINDILKELDYNLVTIKNLIK